MAEFRINPEDGTAHYWRRKSNIWIQGGALNINPQMTFPTISGLKQISGIRAKSMDNNAQY